jgi:hypothetical protein
MSKSATRHKFGVTGSPIPATRVLVKSMDASHFQMEASALIIINDQAGTFTAANVYGGNLGRGYDPSDYTHPLPQSGDEKWKTWRKRGYEEGKVQDFDVLVSLVSETEDAPTGETEDAPTGETAEV